VSATRHVTGNAAGRVRRTCCPFRMVALWQGPPEVWQRGWSLSGKGRRRSGNVAGRSLARAAGGLATWLVALWQGPPEARLGGALARPSPLAESLGGISARGMGSSVGLVIVRRGVAAVSTAHALRPHRPVRDSSRATLCHWHWWHCVMCREARTGCLRPITDAGSSAGSTRAYLSAFAAWL